MGTKIAELITPAANETHVLAALEAMPADLRLAIGWERLFTLVLDAVLAADRKVAFASPRAPLLLTLTTYCYAANVLSSEDIEAACVNEADVAHIARGTVITAADLRRFRRNHRGLVEGCLQRLFVTAMLELPEGEALKEVDAYPAAVAFSEFARRRVNLAVLFDTAFSE